MTKQELIQKLKDFESVYIDSIALYAADMAFAVKQAIRGAEQLDEPKECELEIFEPKLEPHQLTTCDIKTRCSNCKSQVFGLHKGRHFCEYCGAKFKT